MVRRVIATLLTATLLAIPINTASAAEKLCGTGDVQALINSGPLGAGHALSGRETGPADTYGRCYLRIYDPTHTFSTREWIVGGIFLWEPYYALDRPEYDRQAATQYLDQIKVRVWLGPTGGSLTPVSLSSTGYRDFKFLDEYGGHSVYKHVYFVIRPGQLSPGEYQVHFEVEFPGYPMFVAEGTLTVLP